MVGAAGRLTVRLARRIVVTAVSIDHASPLVAVVAEGGSGSSPSPSAPRRVSVYGLAAAPVDGASRPAHCWAPRPVTLTL